MSDAERILLQRKLIDDLYLKYSRQVRGKENKDDTVYNKLKEAQRYLRQLEIRLADKTGNLNGIVV